ncbi:polysaccharide deacetylase family protein [Methylobacterium sp. 77]|uniref:polysaccharide deacetylase family protein n=1 Tax=Methylobacterium sp. 77 TaxID=1101192 RepID=UPI000374CA7E|nr:polysaccharide deacetylase family protein [Methylobacterium sp. 77]
MPSPDLRHRLFDAGFRAIAGSGADRWLKGIARGSGLILTFHHVDPEPAKAYAPNAILTITPDFLDEVLLTLEAKGFDVVGLDSVPERLARPTSDKPFAVLTFDDGYRDNARYAVPILRRHRVPWTLFVTSDFTEGRGRLWWIELERAIGRLDRVRVTLDGAVSLDLPAATADEKTAAFATLYRRLRTGPEERLLATIAELCDEAGIGAGRVADELCLTRQELRSLAADPDLTIGAHTIAHPMLAKYDEDRVRWEIGEGRARIEQIIGRPVRHLSYPVGDPTSAGGREFGIARELGFDTAVTTRPGHLFPGHVDHLHALPRVSANGLHQSRAALGALLSGVPFLAWNRGRRLNVV